MPPVEIVQSCDDSQQGGRGVGCSVWLDAKRLGGGAAGVDCGGNGGGCR